MFGLCCAVLSHLVMSNSLWPLGLPSARLLCPWGFSRQEYSSGLPCPPPGDLPDPGIQLGSPAMLVDSVPAEYVCVGWPQNPLSPTVTWNQETAALASPHSCLSVHTEIVRDTGLLQKNSKSSQSCLPVEGFKGRWHPPHIHFKGFAYMHLTKESNQYPEHQLCGSLGK